MLTAYTHTAELCSITIKRENLFCFAATRGFDVRLKLLTFFELGSD
jgi:hypothetical protein